MITVKGLIQTFKVAKNPHAFITAKLTKKRANITLKNGSKFTLTWPQFRFLRDNYEFVKKYNLQQIDSETYKIHTASYQIVGSHIVVFIVHEIESGIYNYDYHGKVVLDIGGFEGESAAFFWSQGAKKVIIYEPVADHQKFIQENVKLNNINAEIHAEGIGNEDGEVTVAYDNADNCFGLEAEGLAGHMNIKVRKAADVIAQSGAEIAKIDCEGAETSLLNVPKEILRRLEYVMIEAHSLQIRRDLIKKFQDSGFCLVKGNENSNDQVSILYFKRIDH